MKYLFIILLVGTFMSCQQTDKSAKIVEASIASKTEDMKPVLIHTVYFWTKEGTTDAQHKAFEKGLVKLGTCPQIQNFYWGPPAPTEARGVVDNSYNYAINVHFSSVEDEKEYQQEPIHLAFISDHQDLWEKVIVYDNMIQ